MASNPLTGQTDTRPLPLAGRKVFCVGFNKSGTTTLHRIFIDQVGITSDHNPKWTYWSHTRDRAMLDRRQAFSDGGCASVRNLDEMYPDALFVLNTRPLRNWVLSRHKAVARSRAAAQWALTKYVPLGFLSRALNRWVLDNSPRAMARWVAIRNSYHRHVMEYFQGREDKLLVLDIEDPDAPRRLSEFLGLDRTLQPTQANAEGGNSTTRIILDAIGAKLGKEDSERAVDAFFRDAGIEDHAGCLTWFDDPRFRLHRSASDRVLKVLPFLRRPFRAAFRRAAAFQVRRRSFLGKWVADLLVRFFRSEEDVDYFTSVARLGSGSK